MGVSAGSDDSDTECGEKISGRAKRTSCCVGSKSRSKSSCAATTTIPRTNARAMRRALASLMSLARPPSTRAREVVVHDCCHRKRKRRKFGRPQVHNTKSWYRHPTPDTRYGFFLAAGRLNDWRAPIKAHPLSTPRRCAPRTHGLRHDELRGERGQAPGWLGDAPEGGPDRRPGACRDATPLPAHTSGPACPKTRSARVRTIARPRREPVAARSGRGRLGNRAFGARPRDLARPVPR